MEDKKFFLCPSCKDKSFVKIKKEYDGFKVIDKKKTCALCGYEFKDDEDIQYIAGKPLFSDDEGDENFCKDCKYYVIHPYTQKCTLTNKETTALDGCQKFLPKEKEID